jgi:hypothetical protein
MQATAATLRLDVPEEERANVAEDEAYRRFLARLSHQSVVKHFDAYADVPWDDPAFALDPTDPLLELPPDDLLGATAWYRSLPQPVRARLGLHMIATFARIGYAFESILKRGLLEYASRLPAGAPEFRYAYHEVIEEAQHSLMFHEFVQRTGLDVSPPRMIRLAQRQVIGFGRWFPELFFLFVLSGEDPIDWAQRRMLCSGRRLHPLIERISRIHVTEEARHMAFARHFLRRNVPRLSPIKRHIMRMRTPVVLRIASAFMMKPSPQLVRAYSIPEQVMREAYGPGTPYRQMVLDALRKPRELCWELGILNQRWAPWWKALGIYAPSVTSNQ